MSDAEKPTAPHRRVSFGLTAAILMVFVAGMVGMSYAAVPLYRIFCQATGYGGTTRRAEVAPQQILDRVVTVRFDSNISNNLGWSFRPVERQVQVHLGEVGTVSFLAENRTAKTETGTAAFNVAPDQAGAYFNKIACFCFTDQTLAPGERKELGVSFFVDPAYASDPNLQNITTITLSYSFYPATTKQTKPVASAATISGSNPL
jgi:cytochrome c oxidase assembly protein subunit 11